MQFGIHIVIAGKRVYVFLAVVYEIDRLMLKCRVVALVELCVAEIQHLPRGRSFIDNFYAPDTPFVVFVKNGSYD